jgi:E3 ubiquitin-protein ligase synoviolin
MYTLQRLLYGPLRPIEIEQLSEKAWYAVLDTLLAMPSFREDVGGWLLAMFTLLLAGKVWGWIGEGKVDILEQQPPANPTLFHVRLAVSLVASVVFDIWMLQYCVDTVLEDPRPGMMVIFTFEFAILTVFSSFTLARYFLALLQTRVEKAQMKRAIDDRKAEIRAERAAARQNETANGAPAPASPPQEEPIEVDENELDIPGWEEKRRYLFALEVFTDFIKLLIYIVFFTVSITFNGLPMHIMRDVYMTFASFSKRVADFVAYRKATSDMNARYPDATTEEIRGDACIVCREIMEAWDQPAEGQQPAQAEGQQAAQQPAAAPAPARRRDEGLRAKKLPCGHILHLRCLKSWLERQQVCPTCRRPVIVVSDAARAQPGAGGAGQGGAAPQGGQPARRQGRARILNFGPVRIGFLNGPGDQINNIVRQMQNQNQQNAQQQPAPGGQDAAANQHGPNHLGLQVPYAPTGGQQPAAPRATVPNNVQLMQVERQIMQEAQNLGLEAQQLHTLWMMEAELQRLRSWQRYNQEAAAGRQPPQQPAHLPMMYQQPGLMQQPWPPQPPPQVFQGAGNQRFGSGHESLPQGMALPEGWSVMPLHQANVQGPGGNVQQVGDAVQIPAASGGDGVAPAATADALQPQQAAPQGAAGPTDDRGSPLFVPTHHPTTNGTSSTPQADTDAPSSSLAQPPPSTGQTQDPSSQPEPEPRESEHKTPWSSEGWNFVDPPPNANGQPTANGEHEHESSASVATEIANGGPPETASERSREGQTYEGKGKAKAAQVEDVPDEGT